MKAAVITIVLFIIVASVGIILFGMIEEMIIQYQLWQDKRRRKKLNEQVQQATQEMNVRAFMAEREMFYQAQKAMNASWEQENCR